MSLVSFFNKPQVLNFLDTPTFQRHAFGSLIITNAVLRPVATLLDKSATDKERHYSAIRELFQQAMCFVCFYSLAPTFEKFSFHIAKKFPKLQKAFGEFQTFQQVKTARQLNMEARRNNRLVSAQLKNGVLQGYKEIPKVLTGVLRLGDSLGTIIALACAAPLVNNYIIGPTLTFFMNRSKISETPLKFSNTVINPAHPNSGQFYQKNLFPVNQIAQEPKQVALPYVYPNFSPGRVLPVNKNWQA